ncbi:MAG: hypothetical protein CVV41_17150 [Candidatus Riflebacteria bacterium HGW-Riflebacteria-1]|jgi:hypothetical protein|nr:MAG: hypothetical protein CVV41_17150 [Candidatus Riflebacteria bacterium HGW-Riflebacteria-1]
MKKKFLLLLLFCVMAVQAGAAELTTRITHADASGFPVVEAMLQVYHDQPFDLTPEKLSVEESGSKVSEFKLLPKDFTHYLVLVVDRSSSIEPAMLDVKKAAAGLIKSLAGPVNIAILSFGSDIDVDHDFSTDKKSLVEAIGKIRPWGGTVLFDAIYEACEELNTRAGINDLKTVICLTDGQDSTPSGRHRLSRHEPHEVTKSALDKNIRVISLGLGNDIDTEFLGGIASETGGWYLQTATSNQLADLCDKLSTRLKLKKHYRLSYNSPVPTAENPRRAISITLTHNGLTAVGTRPYHTPARIKTLAVEAPVQEQSLSLEELLEQLEVASTDQSMLTRRIKLPATQPVHGLTLASFKGLSSVDCRNLINQMHQLVAEKHQQNFAARKKYLDGHLAGVDQLLREFFARADAPRIKEPESQKIARFIDYLNIRRKEIELLGKRAYEEYLIEFKSSLAELEYFEKTQIGGEKFAEAFFATNTANRTQALQELGDRYVEEIAANQQKMRAKFAASEDRPQPGDSSPASAGAKLNISLPDLPEIKTLD